MVLSGLPWFQVVPGGSQSYVAGCKENLYIQNHKLTSGTK